MRWPWQKRPSTPAWAREVVASIPADQLPDHILTFATSLLRTRNPQTRALHHAKIQAACERLESELSVTVHFSQFSVGLHSPALAADPEQGPAVISGVARVGTVRQRDASLQLPDAVESA